MYLNLLSLAESLMLISSSRYPKIVKLDDKTETENGKEKIHEKEL